ncbi:ABC transporter ATP-binding protein [Alteribacter aurantiacus]|uniref:ABC transporter ATP-binding protein n=1 Tax=Alteribacter aurantiacus TaxID=254410 RepID=UPI0003F4E3AE|nr:ABC transporter ATP-binding protein [Alteribacter aurantiacus]
MIEFSAVSKVFEDGTKAVNSLDFTIEKGEFFVLIGPSGCGKTTTMKMINRLIDPSEGNIKINGKNIESQDIQELRWNIGYVLQQIALFPHMTIAENIAIVPEMKKWKKQDIDKRIDELLSMVGLEPATYRNRKPKELSGGQQQRIGVIRALAGDPDIILMDEPFSALDPLSREQLRRDIGKLQKEIKKTIVFVTHDMDEALMLGNRICVMKDGTSVQIDTPENIMNHPADSFVEEFLSGYKDAWSDSVRKVMKENSTYIIEKSKMDTNVGETQFVYSGSEKTFLGKRSKSGRLVDFENTIPESYTIAEVVDVFRKCEGEILPVVDQNNALIGTVTIKDVMVYLNDSRNDGRRRG